jgi:hypothetical protein
MLTTVLLLKPGRVHSTDPEAPFLFLAGVETSALGRGFGVVALEGLEFQSGSILLTTESGFFDDAVASGIDVVDAAADFVVATDLNFLGRVGGLITLASHFVLERFLTFDPRAAESAFDYFAFFVALNASGGADIVLSGIDVAFEDDVVVEKPIAIVQTFAVVHATRGFGGNLLATSARAIVPEFARFERVSGVVLFAVFDATGAHQTSTVVDGFVADHNEIVFGDFVVQVDTFALVDASLVDGLQCVAVTFARVEVVAVFPLFVDFVFRTVFETGGRFNGQQIAVLAASEAVGFSVERAADIDVFQIVGQTTFGLDITIATFINETSAFQLGAIG